MDEFDLCGKSNEFVQLYQVSSLIFQSLSSLWPIIVFNLRVQSLWKSKWICSVVSNFEYFHQCFSKRLHLNMNNYDKYWRSWLILFCSRLFRHWLSISNRGRHAPVCVHRFTTAGGESVHRLAAAPHQERTRASEEGQGFAQTRGKFPKQSTLFVWNALQIVIALLKIRFKSRPHAYKISDFIDFTSSFLPYSFFRLSVHSVTTIKLVI